MAETATLEQTAVQLINELVGALKAIAGPAVELALTTVRLSCVGNLFVGVALVGLAWALLKGGKKFHITVMENKKKFGYDAPETPVMLCIFSFILSGSAAFAALLYLLDKWNWIGAFAPEVWLANEVIEKIL